jgi:diguanylate cyclase (GGDEF)-like protein/PAS domain S-box-containing protein
MLDASEDIPASGSAELPLSRLVRELRAISSCNQTLMRAVDEQTLLDDICRIVCKDAGHRMAWVGLAEHDEAKTVRPAASVGFEAGYLESAIVTWDVSERGRGPIGTAIRTGQTICLQDCVTDPRGAPWRAEALRRGFRSVIALPLENEQAEVFGSLNIYSAESKAFTADEIRLLEELAGDLAFGVTVLRARAERKRIDAQLQANLRFFECLDRINLAIQEANDLERMLSQVLDATLAIFGCDRAWLIHPCDPQAATWQALMERTRPEYPGALAQGVAVANTTEFRAVMRAVLESRGPLAFGRGADDAALDGTPLDFRIQSRLCTAIYPKTGDVYMFGLHQCSHERIWTEDEKTMFEAIGRRLADGLTSLIAHRELSVHEGRVRTLLKTIPDLVWLKDVDGVYLACNAQFERLAGVAEKDLVGKTDYEFFDKDLADAFRENDRQALGRGKSRTNEEWLTFATDGYRGLFETIKTPMRDQAGRLIGVLGVARDITERNQAQEQLRIAAAAFEAQEGIAVLGADRRILRVNRAFTEITGYANEEVAGKPPNLLRSDKHDDAYYQTLWDRIDHEGSWSGELCYQRKSGERYPAWFNTVAVKSDGGEITHYVATMIDLTERKAAEQQIKRLAYYDSLTQLPNRRLFHDRLQQALADSARSGRKGALLFIGLDNYKFINETAGHHIGDLLLVEVARRLSGCLQEENTAARIEGDEFVVVLEGLSESVAEAGARAKAIGEKILSALGQPYVLAERLHHSAPSIGVTLFIDAVDSLDELLKQADIAMSHAKLGGRNTLRFFDPEMQGALAARAALESALRVAIRDRQFELFYQPQVDGAGRVIGAEALLRWRHPQRGPISPAEFIPLAEETGLILPIGEWVLETACAQLKAWADDPHARQLSLAINISACQFRQIDFVDRVRQALERAGAPAANLKLELTETLVVDDIDGAIATMQALKKVGVGFSVDDFGTGYSSLSYLSRLPLDQLKIDRAFVRNLPGNPNDAAVAQTIITLAKSLGLTVIAEGVETEAQRQFLARHGCPNYQGFLFSKPVDIVAFERLLR